MASTQDEIDLAFIEVAHQIKNVKADVEGMGFASEYDGGTPSSSTTPSPTPTAIDGGTP